MPPHDALAIAAVPPEARLAGDAALLNARYSGAGASAVIRAAVDDLFPGRITVVSSFGAESAVLLHLVSEIDRSVPVTFIDTGRLFQETLDYRNTLIDRLGLTDVRTIGPSEERLAQLDPAKALWMTDPDMCCRIRKTEPLNRALGGFDAWFTGRKRFQSQSRASIELFEADAGRIKVNPLASWGVQELADYAALHELPAHPLVAQGYPSIGCVPCTDRVIAGEDQRAGRWRGTGKTECGIHITLEADGSGI